MVFFVLVYVRFGVVVLVDCFFCWGGGCDFVVFFFIMDLGFVFIWRGDGGGGGCGGERGCVGDELYVEC